MLETGGARFIGRITGLWNNDLMGLIEGHGGRLTVGVRIQKPIIRRDFRVMYSEADAALVCEVCAREVEVFGCTFDG